MVDYTRLYVDAVMAERQWSWSVIGIVYLVMTILIRQFIFRALIRNTKDLDSNVYSNARNLYLRNSTAGWILYFISFLLVVVAWIVWKRPKVDTGLLVSFTLLAPSLFFLSVVLHLLAFAHSLLAIFRQKIGVEKEF